MTYKEMTGKSIRDAFGEFHKANPMVYAEFERQALRAIDAGRTKISAKMILNYIRWNVYVNSTDENFKINDAFQSYFGRLFIQKHPDHADKLDCRKLRNEEDGPYMVEENGQIRFL